MNYNIEGEPLPVVICNLEANETMITEKGAMSWMTPNMKMETTSNGGIGKMFGRAFSGESMFQNRYTSMGGPGMIAFASCFPGCIRPFQIAPGQEIIAQKSAFLASTSGVELSVFFQKRIGSGFFGGEGFIMQRLSGNGLAFLEFDGHIKEYELAPGQQLVIDTGYLAAMTGSCQLEIQTVPGIKNVVFGGEGLFNTVVTGPGRVWLQSMPVSQLAGAIRPFIPTGNYDTLLTNLQLGYNLSYKKTIIYQIKQDCLVSYQHSGSPVLHFVLNSMVLYFIYAIPFAVLYFHSISA